MRLFRSLAPVLAAVALLMALPYDATPHARAGTEKPVGPNPFGSECRTTVIGSHAVAYCHNPYVDADRVSLHIECARWWDIDSDGPPVAVGPAATARLSGRCWKEIRSVWVSHQR